MGLCGSGGLVKPLHEKRVVVGGKERLWDWEGNCEVLGDGGEVGIRTGC